MCFPWSEPTGPGSGRPAVDDRQLLLGLVTIVLCLLNLLFLVAAILA